MPNHHPPRPDSRAVVAEAMVMRAHEQLNGALPFSMSSPQFRLAGLSLQIASLARQMRDEIAASYPPPPSPSPIDRLYP